MRGAAHRCQLHDYDSLSFAIPFVRLLPAGRSCRQVATASPPSSTFLCTGIYRYRYTTGERFGVEGADQLCTKILLDWVGLYITTLYRSGCHMVLAHQIVMAQEPRPEK